jgi:oxygen-independent coproporphyrinogen-3 oxidase
MGIYFHIPFCKKACHYCDFHFSTVLKNRDEMVESLIRELAYRANEWKGQSVKTIYFGGGTPSLLQEKHWNDLANAIHQYLHLSERVEFTVEVNPDDVSEDALSVWKSIGVNRLSVGVQSMDDEVLKWMNRAHSAEQAVSAIRLAQENGWDNINVDFIYGHRQYTSGNTYEDLKQLLTLQPQHVSAYALTVEQKTALDFQVKKKRYTPPAQEAVVEDFFTVHDVLIQAGMDHYELSNYALSGKASQHNSRYWSGDPYLGIGPSAHSFDGIQTRSWNLSNNQSYIRHFLHKEMEGITTAEVLSNRDRANEYWMTGLRTAQGVHLQKFSSDFDQPITIRQWQALRKWEATDHLHIGEHSITCTLKGWMVLDAILVDLFFEE